MKRRCSPISTRLSTITRRLLALEEQLLPGADIGHVFLDPILLLGHSTYIEGAGADGRHRVRFDAERTDSALVFEAEDKDNTRFPVAVTPQGMSVGVDYYLGQTLGVEGTMGVSGRAGVGGPPSGDAQLTIQSGLDSYIRMGESGSGHVDLAFNQAESELEIRPRKKASYQRGDMRLSAENVYPAQPYATNIGSLQEKFLSIHAAELWVETLVAQETIATIGGRVFVGPTTTLTDPVSGDPDDADPRPVFDFYNYIRTRHNQMRPGDTVLLQARARVEFMRVISGPEELDPIESASETYLVHLFKRASSQPEAPEGGGQYVDPKIPQGWSDAIPSGTQTLWMSRVSYTPEDNGPASAWPDPIEFSVDEGYYQGHPERYVIFSSEESPGDPEPPVGDPFGEPENPGDPLVTWDTITKITPTGPTAQMALACGWASSNTMGSAGTTSRRFRFKGRAAGRSRAPLTLRRAVFATKSSAT